MPTVSPWSWTAGSIHPEVVLGCGVPAAAWAWAWHARGRRPPPGQAVRFLGGLLALLLALNGPLHDLSDWYLFSAHMVQHLVLTLVVPPLLLTGVPGFMVDALLRPALAHRGPGVIVRTLTRPLPAFAVYAGALVGWHLPGPYNTALEIHGWHVVEHLALMGKHVLYPFYAAAPRITALSPLADQQLGGIIMWVPSGLIPLAAFTIVFFRWVAAEADEPA